MTIACGVSANALKTNPLNNQKIYLAFGDGTSDARFAQDLSIQQFFFDIQDKGLKQFHLSLNVIKTREIGGRLVNATGYTEFTIFINDPPVNGSCYAYLKDSEGQWVDFDAGTALIDYFKVYCDNEWVDPNKHRVVKYAFKLENTEDGSSTVLSSGPLKEILAVFPAGSFSIKAEVYDEAGAYSTFTIKKEIFILGPEQKDYDAFNFKDAVKKAKANGDSNLLAQLLNADVSFQIVHTSCKINIFGFS